jgi:hypothetical protein
MPLSGPSHLEDRVYILTRRPVIAAWFAACPLLEHSLWRVVTIDASAKQGEKRPPQLIGYWCTLIKLQLVGSCTCRSY